MGDKGNKHWDDHGFDYDNPSRSVYIYDNTIHDSEPSLVLPIFFVCMIIATSLILVMIFG